MQVSRGVLESEDLGTCACACLIDNTEIANVKAGTLIHI